MKSKIIFKVSKHAKERLSQRGIDIKHVKKAILKPDNTEKAYDDRICITKKIKNKLLKVIYSKDGFKDKPNDIIIITAFYLNTKK